jgi:hypothetical protein
MLRSVWLNDQVDAKRECEKVIGFSTQMKIVTLKSLSQIQGYDFVLCELPHKNKNRNPGI